MNAIVYFFGVLVGVSVTIVVTRPYRAWRDGYDAAMKNGTDWEKGVKEGFEAGWNEAFKQMERIAREWNNRWGK